MGLMRGRWVSLAWVIYAGALYGAGPQAGYETEAQALHRQGVLDYRAGRYELALSSFKAVVREYAESRAADASRYMAGLTCYRLKLYGDGLRYLGPLLVKSLPPGLGDQARALAGECWLELGDPFKAARLMLDAYLISEDRRVRSQLEERLRTRVILSLSVAELEALEPEFARKEVGWLILYHLGERYLGTGDYEAARLRFQALIDRFPASAESRAAQRRLAGLRGPSRRVGLLLPMSGQFSRFAREVQSGLDYAFKELAPAGVRLELYDTASDPARAAQGALELILERGVDCVIGPISSREAFAVVPIANQHGVVFILPTATEPGIARESRFIFQLNAYPYLEAEMVAGYAIKTLGMRRLGVLYPEGSRGEGLSEAFSGSVKRLGGEVVVSRVISRENPTLKDLIYPLARQNLDGIFVPGSKEEIVLVAPQLRYCRVRARLLGVEEFMDPEVVHRGEEYIEGAVFAGPARFEEVDEAKFYEGYRLANQREPSELAGLGYDAGRLIFPLLQGEYTRSSVRDRILKMGGYQGVCGRLSWGRPEDLYKIYTIRDGLVEELKG